MSDNRTTDDCIGAKADNVYPLPIPCHITLSTYNRETLFTSAGNCNNLAYLIFETSVLHRYSLFAFCIMPDHVHILCQPGNILVNFYIDLLRYRYEYVLAKGGRTNPAWQAGFEEHTLHDDEVVSRAIHILKSPVRSGLVGNAMDYPYSFVYTSKEYRP